MPSYELNYFNAKIGAEPIRFILHSAFVEFEDNRINKEDWPELKKKLKWEQLPVLKFEGKELFQSAAIARYLARKYNLDGDDEFQNGLCDEYVDAVKDVRAEWEKFYFEEDSTKQEDARKELQETVLPFYMPKFEKALETNGGNWLVGSSYTWADFFLANLMEILEDTVDFDSDVLACFPAVKANKEAVFHIPQIMKYIQKRPKTDF